MNKTILKNYGYNLLYQILLIIIPLITTPYISRVLGAQALGTSSYIQAVGSYFSLFGLLGITVYGQREIAYVQNDQEKRTRIFAELFLLKIVTMAISIGIYSLFIYSTKEYGRLFMVQGIELLAAAVDITWLAQGMEDFRKIVSRNILVKLISVIMIFSFVKAPSDMAIYLVCISGASLFGNLFLWLSIKKYTDFSSLRLKDINVWRHLRASLVFFIPQIAIQIYTLLDRVMLGALGDNMQYLGYYDQSQKIIKLILSCITALSVTMLPRITAVFAQNDTKQVRELINQSFRFVFFMSFPMSLGLCSVAGHFVPWFFGPGFTGIDRLLCVLSPIIIISSVSSVIGTQYLIPTRRIKIYNISVTVGAIANFLLNLLLIPKYLAYGAVAATLIAESLVASIQLYSVRKEFDMIHIFSTAASYFAPALGMVACLNVIRPFLSAGVAGTMIEVITGGAVYFAFLYLMKRFAGIRKDRIR